MAAKKRQYHMYQYKLSDLEDVEGKLVINLSLDDAIQSSETLMYYILNEKIRKKAYDAIEETKTTNEGQVVKVKKNRLPIITIETGRTRDEADNEKLQRLLNGWFLMKKYFRIGLAIVVVGIITIGIAYGDTILLIYRSINAFKEEHLAHSFQTMYEIQPSTKISKGEKVSKFEYNLVPLIDTFNFRGEDLSTEAFLKETKTSGLLVVANNKIAYEKYYLGSDENTRFSSNSVCKSFVSALVGIAIDEGYIENVNDSVAKYIKEFRNTEMEKITIKDCLQMSSGIDFDEAT